MNDYMIAYHGGEMPKTKEEGAAHMANWKLWIESLGDKVINAGTPLKSSQVITSSKVESDLEPNGMNGFAVIRVETIEEAIEVVKNDPFLQLNGSIRLSEMIQMP